jgi:hypothetical protein
MGSKKPTFSNYIRLPILFYYFIFLYIFIFIFSQLPKYLYFPFSSSLFLCSRCIFPPSPPSLFLLHFLYHQNCQISHRQRSWSLAAIRSSLATLYDENRHWSHSSGHRAPSRTTATPISHLPRHRSHSSGHRALPRTIATPISYLPCHRSHSSSHRASLRTIITLIGHLPRRNIEFQSNTSRSVGGGLDLMVFLSLVEHCYFWCKVERENAADRGSRERKKSI